MVALVKGTLVLVLVLGMGHSYHVDMKRLSTQNVEAMQKLRELIEQEALSVEPYLWENYSLAKWLHYYGFNVDVTLEALRKNVQWRADENIGNILKEDWSDMRQRFPYSLETCDKEGRPILYVDVGKWDIAGYLSEGKKAEDRFFRYMILWREETEALVWEWCKAGQYVTQGVMIINMADFSTLKHAGISCLQLYWKIGVEIEPNYPNTKKNFVAVSTPLISRVVYWALTPAFQNQTIIFGHDRSQWEAHLLESIAPDQMPKELLGQSPPGKQQGFQTFSSSSLPPPKYSNFVRIKQRSTTPGDTWYLHPYSAPSALLTEGVFKWKREL